jgi:hypothetical protein
MVFVCTFAGVVFSVIGIFSPRHRRLAKQSFDCALSRFGMRKCDVTIEEIIRSEAVSALMPASKPAAKAFNAHFNVIFPVFALALVITILLSAAWLLNFVFLAGCGGKGGGLCVLGGLLEAIGPGFRL